MSRYSLHTRKHSSTIHSYIKVNFYLAIPDETKWDGSHKLGSLLNHTMECAGSLVLRVMLLAELKTQNVRGQTTRILNSFIVIFCISGWSSQRIRCNIYNLQNWRLEVQQAGSSQEKRFNYSCVNLPNRYKVGECPDVNSAFSSQSDPINRTYPMSNYGLGQLENMASIQIIIVECKKPGMKKFSHRVPETFDFCFCTLGP